MTPVANKILPVSLSLILSVVLHFTALLAFPVLNGVQFFVPAVDRAIMVNLKSETNSPAKLTEPSTFPFKFNKDTADGTDLSKENEEDQENTDENGEERNAGDEVASLAPPDTGDTSEETVYRAGENGEAKKNDSETKEKSVQIPRSARERFSYSIYWLGLQVGTASLEAIDKDGLLRINSQAKSSAFVSTFYKVEDYAESLIMDGIPVHFMIKQHEGKYRSNKETIFDVDNKNVTFFNHLRGTKDQHPFKDGVAWDVISGFFYLRTQPLEIGKTVYINIFDSNKFYRAEINVLKKEKMEVPGIGEVNTVIVRPELKSEGLFQRKGDVLIWLTDDEKRVPVKVQTKVPVGDVVAELSDYFVQK